MHPFEEIGSQVRRWTEEVINTGDASQSHGQRSASCCDRKTAFRDLNV